MIDLDKFLRRFEYGRFDFVVRGHFVSCWLRTRVALPIARWLYRRRWPGVCDECEGTGGIETGGTQLDPPEFIWCAEDDPERCHRCGAKGLDDEAQGPCSECGWNYDDACPTPEEAMCWGSCDAILEERARV